MRALTVSTVLIGIYTVVAGPALLSLTDGTDTDTYAGIRANSRSVALLGLVLFVAIPAGLALFERWRVRRKERNQARYDPTPTAWQWAAKRTFNRRGFVRVLTDKDIWVGGYYAQNSHATGFPQPPALFIERGYYMSDDGAFLTPKAASRGVWVRCDNATAVESWTLQLRSQAVTADPPDALAHGGWTPTGQQRKASSSMSERNRDYGPSERSGYTPQPQAGQIPTGDNPNPKPPEGGFNTPPTTSQDQPPPASTTPTPETTVNRQSAPT